MLTLDVECYQDYFLICFMGADEKVASFEMFAGQPLDVENVSRIMKKYLTLSFNGLSYDLPMIEAALANRNCAELKEISDEIIKSNLPSWKVCQKFSINVPKDWQHIDIFDVVPGKASLKIYAGRMGWPKLQDLPIEPGASVSPDQRKVLREYCKNDLRVTRQLFETLRPQVELRAKMGEQYGGLDLRSKSDAQIAETVLKREVGNACGKTLRPPRDEDVGPVRYHDPKIVNFQSSQITEIFSRIINHKFELAGNGSVKMPDWLKDTRIKIGDGEYQMGVGGLHSTEKRRSVYARDGYVLRDYDVASYYPSIILQQGIAPPTMGDDFTKVYQDIVSRRIDAKRSGDNVTANTLKIVVNGSFGKLGSKYSALYAPSLMIQTTITGQLALLMLIERFEEAGATVVSANTDGVVVLAPKSMDDALADVVWGWELDTSYELERSDYRSLHSRDVNSYLAVTTDGRVKRKGAFAVGGLAKNPQFEIVSDAIAAHVSGEADFRHTIRSSRDLRKFVMLRKVTGGATWRGDLLGKAVRFYYSTGVGADETINYAKNSNKVPQSDGARPCLDLPANWPDDVNVERYVGVAMIAMKELGVDYDA